MNMQTIQIMILMLDSVIKLAPWRIVTEAMDRIGYGAGESLARALRIAAVSCADHCAVLMASIFGPLVLTRFFGGTIPGIPVLSHALFVFYFGAAVWSGLWWYGRPANVPPCAVPCR